MFKEKVKSILYDVHLYHNKLESMIKTVIWVISWVGGILTINDSNIGTASAYFLFSLALLMEFAEKIKRKKERVAIIFHAVFCIINATLLIMAFCVFVLDSVRIDIMFRLSIFLVIYIVVDCILVWIIPENLPKPTESNDKKQRKETIESFNESLTSGLLGNIK